MAMAHAIYVPTQCSVHRKSLEDERRENFQKGQQALMAKRAEIEAQQRKEEEEYRARQEVGADEI
jgi:hypothetical protein